MQNITISECPYTLFSIGIWQSEKSLALAWFGAISLSPTMWQLKRPSMCNFSYITFLMSHVTFLNNTHRWSYKSSHKRLENIAPIWFGAKLCPWQSIFQCTIGHSLTMQQKIYYNHDWGLCHHPPWGTRLGVSSICIAELVGIWQSFFQCTICQSLTMQQKI